LRRTRDFCRRGGAEARRKALLISIWLLTAACPVMALEQSIQATPSPSPSPTQTPTPTPAPAATPSPTPTPSATPSQSSFDDRTASKLLDQITDGLQGRVPNKVLAAFDFTQMQQGQVFRQQLIAFMSRTDSISIHFNLVRSATDNGTATADADVEMEAAPRDNSVPVHKQNRLRFAATNTPEGWKFSDVQPRSFFSLQP
jgi:hypothetical protein